MFFRSILIGLVSAALVALPRALWSRTWDFQFHPINILLIFLVILFMVGRVREKNYCGIPDLFFQIHRPSKEIFSERFEQRALFSLLLSSFGGIVGVEGAAIEGANSFGKYSRTESAHWFELQRRSDVACALAAGISAAFWAPFAAVVIPLEMRTGGRTLSAVASALSAFLAIRYFESILDIDGLGIVETFSVVQFDYWWTSGGALALMGLVGLGAFCSLAVLQFLKYSQASVARIFGRSTMLKLLTAGVFLLIIGFSYREIHLPPSMLFQKIVDNHFSLEQVVLIVLSLGLTLSVVTSFVGSAGWFWPLFSLGGAAGFCVFSVLPQLSIVAILAGGAALLGAVLGIPLAAGVLCYEVTGNFAVALPCLLVAIFSNWLRDFFKLPSLIDFNLSLRGLDINQGRSQSVLDNIKVSDALVSDHVSVGAHDSVSEAYKALETSPYPFVGVIDKKKIFVGLLPSGTIEEEWARQFKPDSTHSNSTLGSLLEAKDLLYRSEHEFSIARLDDSLAKTGAMFTKVPVAPVLDSDEKLVGLLFAHNVRIIYDREVAKNSMFYRAEPMGSPKNPSKAASKRITKGKSS